MSLRIALTAILLLGSAATVAAEEPDPSTIRAGHNLATSVCFACHVISPNQTIGPIMGPGIPSFEEIANRPGVTAQVLVQSMKSAVWHDPALPAQRLPMSHLSDKERSQVAEYILSLRKPQ
jgi:mono/diheme cytochrome c family protein